MNRVDWYGERVDIEDEREVPNEMLVTMEREYFTDLLYGRFVEDWNLIGGQYDDIVFEMDYRRRIGEWV